MNGYQTLVTHLTALGAGLAVAYAYIRHFLGYLSPFEAKIQVDIAHIMAALSSAHAPSVLPIPAAPGGPPNSTLGAAPPVTEPSTK